MEPANTLPRRTSAEDLIRLVGERAKKRDLAKIQAMAFSGHGFLGTMAAAVEFKFLDPGTKDLTPEGNELALAGDIQRQQALVLAGMLRYESYELLLQAIFAKDSPSSTDLDWIARWWGMHDFGNSETNRAEGATTFAKFVEYVGIGSYVAGRRGHSSRIEWASEALDRLTSWSSNDIPSAPKEPSQVVRSSGGGSKYPQSPFGNTPATQYVGRGSTTQSRSQLMLDLGGGRVVEIVLPEGVTASEKTRLISIIDLMIVPAEPLQETKSTVEVEQNDNNLT